MGIIDSGVSILVIDDEELDCVIVKALMKKVLMDPHIDSFQNGKSAIDELSKINENNPGQLPDFIFLDLAMPVMDGWQFLAEFDRLKIDSLKKSKIYILTSSVSIDDVTRSKENPLVIDFINKPLNFEKIKNIFANS
ncbi:response regulator [Mucilaginibacter sp. AW1-7]|jgi:CheY-like chemotaxis protein|uniref:response regulator n=1 Tax=unclassified Mucilaginibacter TaxID=2617802 RepID=UPI0008D70E8E|nr:response regulator [Mucilaginibacter sp. OK283]SEO98371.1 CheY chemotaxis protein or a CheY-like REC (receiver) domain [Mucilaginibacter sp. OK283]